MEPTRIDPATVEGFAREMLRALGAPGDIAAEVAGSLLAAELRGHGSHGVIRLATMYEPMIEVGQLDPAARPEVRRDRPGTASIDATGGFGQFAARAAVDRLIEKADESGVAAVGIRNGNHLGRMGEPAERAVDAGYAFAAFVNTGGRGFTVAPPGSADRRLSTNPIAFGVPTYGALEFPIVVDVATSQVAHGKITKRAVEGRDVPEGWAVSEAGEHLTDAEAFESGEGALLPLGGLTSGYKGFGLATVAELFAGIAGDALVAGQDGPEMANNAAAFIAFDPERFAPREAIRRKIEAYAEHIRGTEFRESVSTGPAAADDRALLPGEAEHRRLAKYREAGIPFYDRAIQELADLAEEYGVEARLA